jgi:hypothetical protein
MNRGERKQRGVQRHEAAHRGADKSHEERRSGLHFGKTLHPAYVEMQRHGLEGPLLADLAHVALAPALRAAAFRVAAARLPRRLAHRARRRAGTIGIGAIDAAVAVLVCAVVADSFRRRRGAAVGGTITRGLAKRAGAVAAGGRRAAVDLAHRGFLDVFTDAVPAAVDDHRSGAALPGRLRT